MDLNVPASNAEEPPRDPSAVRQHGAVVSDGRNLLQNDGLSYGWRRVVADASAIHEVALSFGPEWGRANPSVREFFVRDGIDIPERVDALGFKRVDFKGAPV